jgi:hypothetical protein
MPKWTVPKMARVEAGDGIAVVEFSEEREKKGTRYGLRLAWVPLAGGPHEEKREIRAMPVACMAHFQPIFRFRMCCHKLLDLFV